MTTNIKKMNGDAFDILMEAIREVRKEVTRTIAYKFFDDWRIAIHNVKFEATYPIRYANEREFRTRCRDFIDDIEIYWLNNYDNNEKGDTDKVIEEINEQIREYTFELAASCGYHGNYIDQALMAIARKNDLDKIETLLDSIEERL